MTVCRVKVDMVALREGVESSSRLQSVLRHFWSNLSSPNRYFLKILDAHLHIVVPHITENRLVLHQTHVSCSYDAGVPCCSDEEITYFRSFCHRHHVKALH